MKGPFLALVTLATATALVAQPQLSPQPSTQQSSTATTQQPRPVAAPGEPQNVQILKGMSPAELIRAMQFMSASLGVTCSFCHVRVDNHLDFASDDKEEKNTARQMIRLVMDTNSKYFGNRPQVSCTTCHRGSPRPVSVPVLPLVAPVPQPADEQPAQRATTTTTSGTAATPAANPSRNDIVSRYSHAIGNVNAAALNSIELKGTRETAQGNVPLDVMMANGQTRIVAQTPEGETVNVVGPNGGWMRDPRGTRAMPPVQYAMTRGMLDALRLPMPSEIPQDARVSKDRVGDRDVWVLTYNDASNNRHRLFFDAQTGLLIRHLTLNASPIGYIPQQTDFDDYRDVGGFKVPFVVRYDSVDRGAGRSVRYTEIRPNAKIDPSVFDQPKQ